MKRVAIIGGGISGLSAAVSLEQARRHGAALEYALLESSPRLGGVLRTELVDDCIVEGGPDSFLTEKGAGADLCRQIGLGDQLIASNDSQRKTYIALRGRLTPLPDGLQFMVPTKAWPIVGSSLFSLATKARMAAEYFYRPNSGQQSEDETVAAFVGRHFGQEVVERLADPLLAGVYGGTADSLSASAVLPRFVELETRYGSLSRGLLKGRNARSGSTPRPPLFTSLRGGMQCLADAAAGYLERRWIRTSNPVRALQKEGDGLRVIASDSATEVFDAVIVSTPAHAAASLLEDVDGGIVSELREIPYSSSAVVALGFQRQALQAAPPGFGFLVPRGQGLRMLACTFVHAKFPHRAPSGKALLRCFYGGSSDTAVLSLSDEELVELARRELRAIVNLGDEPLFAKVFRWPGAMAQYVPGHQRRAANIRRLLKEHSGLELAGNAYYGIGIPDCIVSGRMAAEAALASLGMAAGE